MLRHRKNSPRQMEGSVSPSTAMTVDQQHALYFQSNTARSTPSLTMGLDDKDQDDSRETGSSSSELEEGEISERDLPPPPPTQKPIPVAGQTSREPISSRRYRGPPSSYPRSEYPAYAYPSDTEQSVSPFPIPQLQPPFPPYHGQFPPSGFFQPPSYHPSPLSRSPEPPLPTDDESMYLQAQQSLEEVLAMGLTFDDLVSEGMHPIFLKQLFARLNAQSPHVATSTPQPTATPEPLLYQQPTIVDKPDLASDVENFLEALEPTISSPPNGNDDSKKRTLSSDFVSHHPPKRRAFGLVPPRELVIDVSDDDESDEEGTDEDDEETINIKKPSPLPKPAARPFVKIPERPPLRKHDVVKALRHRELQIEAMKRKIEAKMKAQGVQSHDALAQEIAVSIIEKNDESPVISPSVQSPEEVRDRWTPTINTPNSIPSSPPSHRKATASPEILKVQSAPIACLPEEQGPARSEMAQDSRQSTPEDIMAVDDPVQDVNDEEARLVAELEAEREAEEKARQKRRELEERLASARGRRVRPSLSTIVVSSERGGNDFFQSNIISPSQDIGPAERGGIGERTTMTMIEHRSESPAAIETGDEEIAIVDSEDHIVKDDIALMEDVETQGSCVDLHPPSQVTEVGLGSPPPLSDR